MTRRGFLKASSAGLAAIGAAKLAAASDQPTAATQSASGKLGANERLVFGVIGVGGMGSAHVHELTDMAEAENIRLAVVCDVWRRRAHANAAHCKGEACYDYRKLLDRKDIDCVMIATPDHWHFKNAIDALDAGKHVYLQKPMTHTIEQAFKLRDKVQKSKLALQVGTQVTAGVVFWAANEAIQSGLIGDVVWSQGSVGRNNPEGEWNYRIDPKVGPQASGDDYVDWDMWLGHEFGCAEKTPWNPEHYFRFRKYWAYSGGIATDLFYHQLAPMLLAIEGPTGAMPRRVSAAGGIFVQKDGRDVPDTSIVALDYPGEHTILLTGSMANDDHPPWKIRGQHGTIDLGGRKAVAQASFKDAFRARSGGKDEIKLPSPPGWDEQRRGGDDPGHIRNFIDVIRGRQKQLNCDIELGTATQVGISLGVMAYRQQQTLLWDTFSRTAKPA
ncbi:MAG TPA: Gfo/Idh/MocA family oxidoreductase [Phycisphaerae bacterium]|nr:Gfo/Idh/MocA family oxidoreductase [Phycisphaerae bacterium]